MSAKKIIVMAVIVLAVMISLVLGAAFFGWSANAVLAQGPWQGNNFRTMHNNQAVWQLLQSDPDIVLKQRQAGTSLLEIAIAKGVSEQALLDVLAQPMNEMHARMLQQDPQANSTIMADAMGRQFAQDIRVAPYGTMTDMHLFGMNDNGMMNGNGMMQNGMMNGNGGMMGGMMHGDVNAPAVNATPVPATQKADREININAKNMKFDTSNVTVKKGETIKFNFVNQDNFMHNVISESGKFSYTMLPANRTTTVLWSAPTQAGIYAFTCTFHPNMSFMVTVE